MKEHKPAMGGHKKVKRSEQVGYEISVDTNDDELYGIYIRLGTMDRHGNYTWNTTFDVPVKFKPNQTKLVMTVYDDQLPVQAQLCYYQLLCETENKEGHPENFFTIPTKLE